MMRPVKSENPVLKKVQPRDMSAPSDWEFEITFYENILQRQPDFAQALAALGDLYTKKGWYEKGLTLDLRLFQLRPHDPTVLYNLACSYSLLGKIDPAFAIMRMAFESGYDNFQHLLNDRDLKNLLKDQRFQDYLRDLRQKKTP